MPQEMERRQLPVLISANALFDHKNKRFREVPMNLNDLNVALDSAGFVAMHRYGNFPWTMQQYIELATTYSFAWWSQMDFCCEPEIASDRAKVLERVEATGQMLHYCRQQYFCWMEQAPEIESMTSPPMPIIQGWNPDDYRYSIDLADTVLQGKWPKMIGVGSVCRRKLTGPDGLWRILHTIDEHLPEGVTLHLFGVKGAALGGLADQEFEKKLGRDGLKGLKAYEPVGYPVKKEDVPIAAAHQSQN